MPDVPNQDDDKETEDLEGADHAIVNLTQIAEELQQEPLSEVCGLHRTLSRRLYSPSPYLSLRSLSTYFIPHYYKQWVVDDINVTQIFRRYQKEALVKASTVGLTWNDLYELL